MVIGGLKLLLVFSYYEVFLCSLEMGISYRDIGWYLKRYCVVEKKVVFLDGIISKSVFCLVLYSFGRVGCWICVSWNLVFRMFFYRCFE